MSPSSKIYQLVSSSITSLLPVATYTHIYLQQARRMHVPTLTNHYLFFWPRFVGLEPHNILLITHKIFMKGPNWKKLQREKEGGPAFYLRVSIHSDQLCTCLDFTLCTCMVTSWIKSRSRYHYHYHCWSPGHDMPWDHFLFAFNNTRVWEPFSKIDGFTHR